MYTLPTLSSTTPNGPCSSAAVAGPPSPVVPSVPLPARVVMMPSGATLRTTKFPLSAMSRLPEASTYRPVGSLSSAWEAGPLSPVYPAVPVPATVVMMPLVSTLRTTLNCTSEKYTLPDRSVRTPHGAPTSAAVAGPPSPVSP